MSYQFAPVEPERRVELIAERRDEEPAQKGGRALTVASALLVMALFAGGLWFAYVEGTHRSNGVGDVPLIRADARPIKIKPTDPGGLQVPDRAMLIYGSDRQMSEHLLAPPEKPVARPTAPAMPAAVAPPPSPPSAVGGGEAAAPAAAEPKLAPTQTTGQLPGPARGAAKLETAKDQTAKVPPGKTGGIRLQLGSVRSEGAARLEWGRLKHHNADLLGHFSGTAIRADLGEKGVYFRIQTGPVSDLAAADRICGELKRRNVGCIIVR